MENGNDIYNSEFCSIRNYNITPVDLIPNADIIIPIHTVHLDMNSVVAIQFLSTVGQIKRTVSVLVQKAHLLFGKNKCLDNIKDQYVGTTDLK